MSVDGRSIAARIRELSARGALGAEEAAGLAELGEAFETAVAAVNEKLVRCRAWLDRGLVAEAVGYGADCGLLEEAMALRRAGTSEQWRSLCAALGLPRPSQVLDAELEALELAEARFRTLRPLLETFVRTSLGRGDVFARLAALRALRTADMRNPVWLEQVRTTEREALAAAPDLIATAEAAGDLDTLRRIGSQLAAPWRAHVPPRLREMADAATARLAAAAAAADWQELERRVHAAASSMDEEALGALHAEWQEAPGRLGAPPPPDAEERVAEAFAWLAARRAAKEGEAQFAASLAALERALDEGRGADDVERLYAAALRHERPLPGAVESRVAARLTAAREAQSRRHRLAVAALVALALVGAAVGITVTLQRAEKAHLDGFAAQIERLLEERRVPEAAALVAELPPERTPRLSAAIAQAGEAESRWAEQRAAVRSVTDSVRRALDAEAGSAALDDAELGRLGPQIASVLAVATADEAVELDHLEAERSALLERRRADAARGAREAWKELSAELTASTPLERWSNRDRLDPTLLAARRQEAAAQRDRIAALRSQAAAAEAAEMGVALARLDSEIAAADRRLAAIERAKELQAWLDDPPMDEDQYADHLREALAQDGDLLADYGVLPLLERVAEAAEAGRAVKHWREVVAPRARRVSRGAPSADAGVASASVLATAWRPATAAEAQELAGLLALHVQAHPATPYGAAVQAMRELLEHQASPAGADGADRAAALVARVRSLGFEDLYRTPLRGGGAVYRRGPVGGAPLDRVLSRRGDLRVPAERLAPRGDGALPAAAPQIVPVSEALGAGLSPVTGAFGVGLAERWLDMIEAIERRASEDPLPALDLLTQLWTAYGEIGAPPGDPLMPLVAPWLRTSSVRHREALVHDWVARSDKPASAESQAAARAAEAALAAMPKASQLREALERWWGGLVRDLAPARPAGVLSSADADGVRRAVLRGGGDDALVIAPRPGERGRFQFLFVRVVEGEGFVDGPGAPSEAIMLFRQD